MKRNKFFWISVPLGIACLFVAAILALPSLVSSSKHRSTIEALASSVTGRKVHIAGNLSLSLFPEPQLIAGNVTIDGNNGETIKARSLTLDIAMPALLRGQLNASSLTLQSPVIAFPWPLPGGPAAIAPPPWLTTLHAQINDGRIVFGNLIFSSVSADIFTAPGGAVSISGTGVVLSRAANITLSLGASDLAGQAPLAVQVATGNIFAHFSGSFSADNIVTGSLNASQVGQAWLDSNPSQPLTLSATLNANPNQTTLNGLKMAQGAGALTGSAELDLIHLKLNLVLSGSNIVLPSLLPRNLTFLPHISIHDNITVNQLKVGGIALPHVEEISDISQNMLKIESCNLSLPGKNSIMLSGVLDQNGAIHAQTHLITSDISGLTGMSDGTSINADLTSEINGNFDHLVFGPIAGTLDGSTLTGSAILSESNTPSLFSEIHIKQLNLIAFSRFVRVATSSFPGDGSFELSADHAMLENLTLSRVLIDGGFSKSIVIRHFSASLYNGVLAGGITVQPDGTVSGAHGFFSIPSAAPLAVLLPAQFAIPATVLSAPVAVSISAAGEPSALSTSAAGTLGQFSISASPMINLINNTMAGAITLRHPSAIAAFRLFGLNAGLQWPGAGSVSLRADMKLSSAGAGLPNFVLSMGDLTAAGNITWDPDSGVAGTIDADTLALPPLPNDLSGFWKILPDLNGKIQIIANRVLISGVPWFGPAHATLNMQSNKLALNILNAGLGNGVLQAALAVSQIKPIPPLITATIRTQKADLSKTPSPVAFPIAIPSGTANLDASVTGSGFTPQTWLATLTGNLDLQSEKGSVSGFDLAALAAALNGQNRSAALKIAAESGKTDFSVLDLTGKFDHGTFKLDNASLTGSAGTAQAMGSIDLSDDDVALSFGLMPKVEPSVTIGLAIIGTWRDPRKVTTLKSALAWQQKN